MEQDIKLIRNKDAKLGFRHTKIIVMTYDWKISHLQPTRACRGEKDKPEPPEVSERVLY